MSGLGLIKGLGFNKQGIRNKSGLGTWSRFRVYWLSLNGLEVQGAQGLRGVYQSPVLYPSECQLNLQQMEFRRYLLAHLALSSQISTCQTPESCILKPLKPQQYRKHSPKSESLNPIPWFESLEEALCSTWGVHVRQKRPDHREASKGRLNTWGQFQQVRYVHVHIDSIYTYIYICTYICLPTYIHTYMHACIHACALFRICAYKM